MLKTFHENIPEGKCKVYIHIAANVNSIDLAKFQSVAVTVNQGLCFF